MNRPRSHVSDERILQALKSGLFGMEPQETVRSRLMASAASTEPGAGVNTSRPDWVSPSTARRMRERQRSISWERYSYLVAATNMRFAW